MGTYKAKLGECYNCVLWALKDGYRHIDTAAFYDNEKEIGKAIKDSGVLRKDVFVTTKLWNSDHDDVKGALTKSLKNLGTDYVDLYLMHFPVSKTRITAWKEMEKLYSAGLCKSIGVSNFTVKHLKELLKKTSIVPTVNQVEFHPYLY